MLAAPEAAAWAAHPAARTGKLEKRGRLKDEWKANMIRDAVSYMSRVRARVVIVIGEEAVVRVPEGDLDATVGAHQTRDDVRARPL